MHTPNFVDFIDISPWIYWPNLRSVLTLRQIHFNSDGFLISGKAIQFSDRKLFVPTRKNCQSCKSISTSIKGSVAKYLFFLDYLWENCEWYEIDLASKISNALRFVTRRCLKSYHCTRFAELTTLEIIKNISFNQFGHDVK